MLEDLNTALDSTLEFVAGEFIPGIVSLDPNYLAIGFAVFGVLIVFLLLLFKVRNWVIAIIKRVILLTIIVVSAYFFITSFYDKLSLTAIQQAPLQTILIGGLGGLGLVVSLTIAVLSLRTHARKEEPSAPEIEPTTIQQPKMLSTQALTKQIRTDRSLLAVLSYVIIAEFGIFSSKTFPAPSSTVGLIFFGVFFVGAFIFIKTSYHNYVRGVAHLVVATVFAVLLSIFLGHFWGEISLSTLLSLEYFGTTALVAVITGIAISLLMGSKS